MVGTTRPRVSKFMNEFKKKGLVRYKGGLQINRALVIAFLENRPLSVKKTLTRQDAVAFGTTVEPRRDGGKK
jgi:hypothetical protein